MSRLIDLTGKTFNNLTVLKKSESKPSLKSAIWLCRCICGKEINVTSVNLKNGQKSCGCLRPKPPIQEATTNPKLRKVLKGMKDRCVYDKNNPYAKKGIKICDEWMNDPKSFYKWALENGFREDLTIDRIDSTGNYEPNNCRWSTMKEQQNNRSNNRIIEINGTSKTVSQWVEESGVPNSTFHNRLNRGLIGEDLIKPSRKKNK